MSLSSRPHSRSELLAPSRPLERPGSAFGRTVAVLALGLMALGALSPPVNADAPRVAFAVITSPDVRVNDVSVQDVRRLMLGERRFWRANIPATALMPSTGSPARLFLLERLFRMTEKNYRRHTLEQLYRGELDYAPLIMGSTEEAVAFVAAGHGAITLVPLEKLPRSAVHVLRVDGKLPHDDGYPLVR